MAASYADKGKSEPKPKEGIAERTQLRRERIAEIEREEKNNNLLFKHYFADYQSPSDMYKKLWDGRCKKWSSSIFNQRSVR